MTSKGSSLRQSAQQAILWSAGLNLFRDVLQFGQMLILVRLLDPSIYGMAGLATTFISFIGIISFQHVIPHVLQVRGDSQVNYHLHFTVGVVLNGFLFVVANAIAFGLGFTSQYAQLQPLLHLLSLTFLLSVPVDMRVKMLERDHNWSRLRIIQMAGIVISIASGIGMALFGAGVYALIVPGLLASTVFMIDLFLFSGWRPRWQWNYASYRDALHFGINRAGSNALNGGRYLLQNTLITQHFQFSTLGVFGRAEGLANMFCGRIAQEVSNALYPVITRAEAHSERFQRISGLVLQSVAWVVIPIAAFFSMEAENIVKLLFGSKWLAVIPLLPLAMAIGVTVSIGSTAYRLLLANDQSRLCLRSDMAAFAMAATAMMILIPQGLIPYLIGATFVGVAIATILVALLIRTRGLRVEKLIVALVPPAIAAIAGYALASAMQILLPNNLPSAVQIAPSALLFAATYTLVLRVLFHTHLAEIMEYLPGGKRIGKLLYLWS
jgi:teichuronic acid exporter